MNKILIFLVAACLAGSASGEAVVPIRTLRAGTLITAGDLSVESVSQPGTYEQVQDVVGMETRVALYAGQAIPHGAIGLPAIVDRNQIIDLVFLQGTLRIVTEGRALARGGAGDRIRVMNQSSRLTLFGTIQEDGSVAVSE